MKTKLLSAFIVLTLVGCATKYEDSGASEGLMYDASGSNSGQNNQGEAGVVTAGEWNDLDNWQFWNNLLNNEEYSKAQDQWSFYSNNRVSVFVTANSQPACNITVELQRNGTTIWATKTDNVGKAELWVGLFQQEKSVDSASLSLVVNGQTQINKVKFFNEGVNEISVASINNETNRVELAFIVDATGSMGDELEFLKEDLLDVIQRVQEKNNILDIYTGTVFYRDEGDEYVVKHSAFTSDVNATLSFIKKQKASGGGDYEEAVHTALSTTLSELQWSDNAKTRIAFLILDAPPHKESAIKKDIQVSITSFAQKGIKIIPVTASGINEQTEFLTRAFAIATNGTYVFITDDSGIGNDHLEPSVGEYQVEKLNDLLVRLITKYSN